MKSSKPFSKLTRAIFSIISPSALGVIIYLTVFIVTVVDDQIEPYKNAIFSLKTSDFKGTFLYRIFIDIGNFTKLQLVSGVMVYAFWIIAGIVIYMIAYRIVSNEREVVEDISMRHFIWPQGSDVNLPIKYFFKTLVFRFAIFVVIIIYVLRGIPLLRNWWQSHHQKLMLSMSSLKVNLLLLIFEFLFLHILVVLIRLFFLRRRLLNT